MHPPNNTPLLQAPFLLLSPIPNKKPPFFLSLPLCAMDTQGIGKSVEKKPRPLKEQALNCPRCSSTNTKFCYYNNYSLSQPRYLCKTCRRYWTEGGCLRSVPVGGGSRKNKRSSSSSKINNKVIIPNYNKNNNNNPSPPRFSQLDQNPNKIHDLNLAGNPYHYNNIGLSEFSALPFGHDSKNIQNPSFSNHHLPVMEFFKTGNMIGFDSVYGNSSGFSALHDFKPSLGFSVDGLENGYGNLQGVEDDNSSIDNNMIFPLGDLKQVSRSDQQFEQDRTQGEANGLWNGMLSGGSSY